MNQFLGSILLGLVLALIGGWFFMLAVGVAHAGWWPAIPTIGYWTAVLIVWLLQGIFESPLATLHYADN